MFPVLALIMQYAVHMEGMPENYFVMLFSNMYMGMAPLISMASILSEEKENNTLCVLMMANVKPWEYITGVSICTCLFYTAGTLMLAFTGGYRNGQLLLFIAVMEIGMTASLFIGAAIGAACQSQMKTTSIAVPAMMICAFLPMLSMFNKTIRDVSGVIYSEQVSRILQNIQSPTDMAESIIIIAVNIFLAVCCFLYAYKKKTLV